MTEPLRNRTGLPRPLTRGRIKLENGKRTKTRLPIPWSSEYDARENAGVATVDSDGDKAAKCARFEVCLVCGDPLPRRFWVFYVQPIKVIPGQKKPNEWNVYEGGLHPRCAKLTAQFCNFLREHMVKGHARILSIEASDVDKSKAIDGFDRTWPLKARVNPDNKRDMYRIKEKAA